MLPDPVAPTLERILRQRDPTPGLAREEPCEVERQPRLAGPGDRFHEAAAPPRRRLQVADVGLDRAAQQGLVLVAPAAVALISMGSPTSVPVPCASR